MGMPKPHHGEAMNTLQQVVTTSDELVAATKNAMVRQISVR
jgi:hypothetical protein